MRSARPHVLVLSHHQPYYVHYFVSGHNLLASISTSQVTKKIRAHRPLFNAVAFSFSSTSAHSARVRVCRKASPIAFRRPDMNVAARPTRSSITTRLHF